MRKIICMILVFSILGFASCKKDDSEDLKETAPIYAPNYMPLDIGNYWVYENYKVENHQETLLDKEDSIRITKDTIIGNETYFVIEGVRFPSVDATKVIRDSSGYIVDVAGNIVFTNHDIGSVYFNRTQYDNDGDTVFNMQYYTALVNENIPFDIVTFPETNLDVLNRVTDFITFPQSTMSDSLKYRSVNSYFIDGIGQASDAIFYASASFHYEKRLIRFYINTPEKK